MEKSIESVIHTGKKIMLDNVFFGYFLAMLDKSMSKDIETAGVRMGRMGPELLVEEEFWGDLNDIEAKAILLHELII